MLMKPDPGLIGKDQEDPEAEVEGPISAAEAATKDLGEFACACPAVGLLIVPAIGRGPVGRD